MTTVAAIPDAKPSADLRNYALVTGAYWADTLTDGALRMLVLLYFHERGYSAIQVSMLFLFYEVFGIVTNLVGGWLAARLGLKATLFAGLGTQLVALSMLMASPAWLTVAYVMVAQALSGIAKDLTKMSSKSAVKLLVTDDAHSTLFKYVAILTGSKNALKGVGFFVGGLLLYLVGFRMSVMILAALVATALVATAILMRGDLGTANKKAKFRQMFSNNRAVNLLAAARVFLFASRDVWFVVGLPVFLYTVLGWNFWQVGGFMAIWIIEYGIVQAGAPTILRRFYRDPVSAPDGATAMCLAFLLATFPAAIAVALGADLHPASVVVIGLILFGIIFALNSAVHSFLILAYTDNDKVAMNVGFYYTANACGRLAGTVLSGLLYQKLGLAGCLWVSAGLAVITGLVSCLLPTNKPGRVSLAAVGGEE
ncbi:MAG: organoarsenical effux MFS transporter ArsJ [Acidobacteria bacterium]|nr:organoarsenical effux MFS transporter ArsJ [Acidobacteriota bacterium]